VQKKFGLDSADSGNGPVMGL